MDKKRLIILILVSGGVAALVVFFSQQPKKAPVPPPTKQAVTAPKPTFPALGNILKEPAYDTSLVAGAFPKEILAYRINKLLNPAATAASLAGKFGFSGTPREIDGPEGKLFVWQQNNRTFSFGGDPPHLSFYSPLPSALKLIQETDLVFTNTANQFLSSFIPAGGRVSAPTIAYLTPIGNDPFETDRARATIIQLTYRLSLEGTSLIAGFPDAPTFRLWYDADKSLVSFSGTYYPNAQKTNDFIPIISLDEAKQRLQTGGGKLLSAFSLSDKNTVQTQYYSFSMTRLAAVSLAYYYLPGQELLSPVFIFTGGAVDERTKKSVDTISLVSATP